jgi:hypothetical protein
MHKCHKTRLSQAVWRLCAGQTVLLELFHQATHLRAGSCVLPVRVFDTSGVSYIRGVRYTQTQCTQGLL